MVRATKVVKSRPTNDGWTNVYSGLGVTGRDKRLGAAFTADRLDEQTCEEMWLGDDICARIIEAQPEAELRQGFELVVSDTTAAPPSCPSSEARRQGWPRGQRQRARAGVDGPLR
jgi:hypothetical protein